MKSFHYYEQKTNIHFFCQTAKYIALRQNLMQSCVAVMTKALIVWIVTSIFKQKLLLCLTGPRLFNISNSKRPNVK